MMANNNTFPAEFAYPLPLPAGDFITCAGYRSADVWLACAAFDSGRYRKTLFQQYGIHCPLKIAGAATKRQAEFLASRWLTREIFARLGVPGFILSNHPDRSPCWPAGFTASLSHSAGMVFLVAAAGQRLAGNDVEKWMSATVADETAQILMTETEKSLLMSLSLPWPRAATLLFSLKESLYKALWPVTGQYIDFLQVQLTAIDEENALATLRLEDRLSAHYARGACFNGTFRITDEQVFSWILSE